MSSAGTESGEHLFHRSLGRIQCVISSHQRKHHNNEGSRPRLEGSYVDLARVILSLSKANGGRKRVANPLTAAAAPVLLMDQFLARFRGWVRVTAGPRGSIVFSGKLNFVKVETFSFRRQGWPKAWNTHGF